MAQEVIRYLDWNKDMGRPGESVCCDGGGSETLEMEKTKTERGVNFQRCFSLTFSRKNIEISLLFSFFAENNVKILLFLRKCLTFETQKFPSFFFLKVSEIHFKILGIF